MKKLYKNTVISNNVRNLNLCEHCESGGVFLFMLHVTFQDNKNPEQLLRFYVNLEDRLYIEVGILSDDNFNGFITLGKPDVIKLIKKLKKAKKLMK